MAGWWLTGDSPLAVWQRLNVVENSWFWRWVQACQLRPFQVDLAGIASRCCTWYSHCCTGASAIELVTEPTDSRWCNCVWTKKSGINSSQFGKRRCWESTQALKDAQIIYIILYILVYIYIYTHIYWYVYIGEPTALSAASLRLSASFFIHGNNFTSLLSDHVGWGCGWRMLAAKHSW